MPPLDLSPRFQDGDAFYEALVNQLDTLGEEEGRRFLARLTLILANQLGDQETLIAALQAARESN